MSDIVERLRSSSPPSDLTREAADRMEKIEFSLTRERNDAQTAAQRAAKRTARLAAALEQITFRSSDKVAIAIARAALE
jgi:hypothetical protein